jgi:hypothetical protein
MHHQQLTGKIYTILRQKSASNDQKNGPDQSEKKLLVGIETDVLEISDSGICSRILIDSYSRSKCMHLHMHMVRVQVKWHWLPDAFSLW